jgi:Clr5 domain
MPPTAIDLNPFKLEIYRLYIEENATLDDVHNFLAFNGVKVSSRTLRRRIENHWRFKKNQVTEDSIQLRLRMIVLFFDVGVDDETMLFILQSEGYNIAMRRLKILRLLLGMRRRLPQNATTEQLQAIQSKTEKLVKEELDKGTIITYGRGLLYSYFRNQGHIISR